MLRECRQLLLLGSGASVFRASGTELCCALPANSHAGTILERRNRMKMGSERRGIRRSFPVRLVYTCLPWTFLQVLAPSCPATCEATAAGDDKAGIQPTKQQDAGTYELRGQGRDGDLVFRSHAVSIPSDKIRSKVMQPPRMSSFGLFIEIRESRSASPLSFCEEVFRDDESIAGAVWHSKNEHRCLGHAIHAVRLRRTLRTILGLFSPRSMAKNSVSGYLRDVVQRVLLR